MQLTSALVSPLARLQSLLPSSGPSVISLINSASSSLKSSSASSVKSSVAKVSDSVLSIPLSKGLLNPSAAEEVRDFIRYSAYTSYGTHHESSGLDEYERVAGVKVEGRKEGVKEWRFWEDKKGRGDEVREWRGRGRGKGGENTSFSIVGVGEARNKEGERDISSGNRRFTNVDALASNYPCPLASPTADGLRDDYYLSSTPTSPGSLSVRRIIVECKHRMNGFSSSVPLYDMIQCCVYAVMHGCGGGEILEVFRVGEEGDEGGGKKEGEESKDVKGGESTSKDKVEPSTTSGPSTKGPKIKVKSTPVPLDSPPYNHLNNIRGILVPRLYAISNAVRAARRDVGVRYRLMMGVAREDWAGVKDTFGEVRDKRGGAERRQIYA